MTLPTKEDFEIYSPEATDGGTDWPSAIGKIGLGLLFVTICSPLLIEAIKALAGN